MKQRGGAINWGYAILVNGKSYWDRSKQFDSSYKKLSRTKEVACGHREVCTEVKHYFAPSIKRLKLTHQQSALKNIHSNKHVEGWLVGTFDDFVMRMKIF